MQLQHHAVCCWHRGPPFVPEPNGRRPVSHGLALRRHDASPTAASGRRSVSCLRGRSRQFGLAGPRADTPVPESDATGSVQRQGLAERWRFLVAPALLTLVTFRGITVQNAVLSKEQTMKLARVGVIAAAILAVATVAWAQKPDFSGTWTLDPASAPAAGGGGGRGGGGGALGNGPATVKQTADALTIERTMGDANVTLTYKLDGTESRNMMMGGGGQSADSISTAKWDGPKLTIVTKQEMGGQVTESTQVWTVEGSTLTVETTNARGTQKRVYKK
jgi:hypothetical protein